MHKNYLFLNGLKNIVYETVWTWCFCMESFFDKTLPIYSLTNVCSGLWNMTLHTVLGICILWEDSLFQCYFQIFKHGVERSIISQFRKFLRSVIFIPYSFYCYVSCFLSWFDVSESSFELALFKHILLLFPFIIIIIRLSSCLIGFLFHLSWYLKLNAQFTYIHLCLIRKAPKAIIFLLLWLIYSI